MSKTETVLEGKEVASDSNPIGQMAFTPGPWHTSENEILIWAPAEVGEGFSEQSNIRICTLNSDENYFSPEKRRANARLIAVSPEMFELLYCIVNQARAEQLNAAWIVEHGQPLLSKAAPERA